VTLDTETQLFYSFSYVNCNGEPDEVALSEENNGVNICVCGQQYENVSFVNVKTISTCPDGNPTTTTTTVAPTTTTTTTDSTGGRTLVGFRLTTSNTGDCTDTNTGTFQNTLYLELNENTMTLGADNDYDLNIAFRSLTFTAAEVYDFDEGTISSNSAISTINTVQATNSSHAGTYVVHLNDSTSPNGEVGVLSLEYDPGVGRLIATLTVCPVVTTTTQQLNSYYITAGVQDEADFCPAPGYDANTHIKSYATTISGLLNQSIFDENGNNWENPYNIDAKFAVFTQSGFNTNQTLNGELDIITIVGNSNYVSTAGNYICDGSGGGNPF
jgi:hypothetical protein